MPNGFEAFAQNAIALGGELRERRRQRKMADAMVNFDTDPDGAIAGVTKVDPVIGWNMRRQVQQDAIAAQEAQRAKATEALKTVTGLLGPIASDPNATPDQIGQAYDSLMPILQDGLGMNAEEIVKWKQMVITNPSILKNIDDQLRVVAPGSAVFRGATEVARNPYPDQIVTVGSDASGRSVVAVPRTYDGTPQSVPTTGTPPPSFQDIGTPTVAAGGGGGFMDSLAQIESGDRNIPSGVDSDPAGPGTKSQGHFQITTPTWQDFAGRAGVDLNQYPNAMSAPREVQAQVASVIPFSRFGPRTQRQMRAKYGNLDGKMTVGELASLHGGGGQRMSLAAAPGGAQPTTPGGARTMYSTPPVTKSPGADGSVLSHEEVKELGLSPSVRWQRVKGEIKPIGGANYLNKVMKQDQVYESITSNTARMEQAARALLNHKGLERAAGINSYIPSMRGGKANDFERRLDAIKSQIGFAILNDMRQMSPTGGALGNVSNFEVETLQRNIDTLDVTQSPAQLRDSLRNIIDYAAKLRGRYQRAYKLDRSKDGVQGVEGGGGGAPKPRSTSAPPPDAINMLKQNPSPQRRQQFDAIFGPGAAKKALGGK